MLEHSAMYLNVTPPYEEEPTFFPDLYSRIPGPCELQDPVWSKMNLGGQVNKKRKKSDNKPQAQLNKCNNEKRRREQENIYIEELAELISANFADMSSFAVKPDKCAILQETVKQIRRIKQQEVANEQNPDPVQQGEVSSSKPSILSNEVYGPLLLEALEGFLFVISNDGKVEHVTENVANYIIYTKEEMVGKTIYNFLHPGDHTKFASTLLPMSIEWGNDQTPPRSKSIDVRLLVKDENEELGEEKRQGVTCYELMHISSTQLRDSFSMSSDDDSSDSGPCLLCVASRISQRDKASCSFEQFTTKLDPLGKILDTSGVTDATSQALRTDLKNKIISQLVPAQDVHKVSAHLKETLTTGQAVSQVYRIQVAPDKFVQVQTKSKLFKTNTLNQSNDGDFIMATHTIITENDSLGPGDPGGGSSTSGSSIGGPLMTSVLTNGTAGGPGGQAATVTRNGTISSAASDISQSTNSSGSLMNSSTPGPGMGGNSVFGPGYLDSDFSIDFPTTTWPDLEANWTEAARPDSRQSITPVSAPTSRPPSQPSYSNAPTAVAQSPMGAHYSAQPSPSLLNHQPGSQQSQTSFNSWMETDFNDQNCFEQENKDTKENVQQSVVEAPSLSDSHRLRSLLTTASNTSMAASQSSQETSSGANDNRDRILKALLNQQDEDQGGHGGGPSRGDPIMSRGALIPNVEAQSKTGGMGNNMLRQLLNDKTEDDEKEKMSGLKKPSELLQQLLKKDSHDDDDKKNDSHSHGDSLLRSLGFPPGSPDRRGHKRSMDDKDENRDSKRNSNDGQVSSTGSSDSELCKKNKMLASLLAKQTHTPPTIPSVPPSVISALPQEKLPRIATDPAKAIGGTMAQLMNSARRNSTPIGRSFLQANLQRVANQVNSGFGQATSTSDNHINWGENNNIHSASATDTVPAELLEELMDLVPDNNADITLLLDQHKPPQTSSGLSEALAIYTIQKDLMQCETAVKSPTSPNISLPARPPAYPQVSTQNNMQGYPPPPNYLQASKYVRVRSGAAAGPQYATASNQQQLMLQRKQLLQQQQQQQHEKQRLLQQQKQQQLLIPSNATAADMNNIQNIDSIMNNTVAPPNVSLQRSSSVPDAQLSPNYSAANSLSQQNQRGQQSQQQNQPYSPLSQMPSPLGGQNFQNQTSVTGSYQSSAARMSPQSQFNAQLSPRQAYPQGNANPSSGAWPSQRMTIQQNPMLNAQLTRAPQQGNRSLNSPGTGPSRHSPFAADQFPPPSSPSSQGFTAQAQTQYMQRLQRANSVPTSNSAQLTGGLGSPRSYSGGGHHAPPHYPTAVPQTPPQNPNPMQAAPGIAPPHHMMYQQQGVDSYNCGYDQTQVAYSPDQRGGLRLQQQGSHLQSGVATNPTSEFVRQELRAVVSNRTAQGGGASQPGGATAQQRNAAASQQQSNLLGQQQGVDLEALGINFEMAAGASDSPKLWAAMASDLVGAAVVSPAQQQTSARTTMEEIRQGDHAKTSLLQQLLSDQSK